MKRNLVLLVALIGFAAAAAEKNETSSHCPENSKPGQFVLVPHETDCDKFYMCMGPKETLKTCRKGQLFNPVKHRCDKAENVQCDSEGSTNSPPEPEKEHCPKDGKPGKFMLVPHETDCDKFYMCMGPKETLKVCRKGQLFNKEKRRCDKAENVVCDNEVTTVSTFEVEDEDKHCPADADPKKLTRVAHETDCDKYYMCYKGKEKLHTCKQGKLFSSKSGFCVTASKVDCGDRTTAAPTTTVSTTTTEEVETEVPEIFYEEFKHCPENNTRVVTLPHETDCDKYWLCSARHEKLKQCKEGKLYSERHSLCLSEHKVDCGDRTTVAPTTTTEEPETEAPETETVSLAVAPECPNNHRFETFPHPEDCHKFFVCRNGEAFEKDCREKFVFDALKKRCVKETEENSCSVETRKGNEHLKPTMTPLEGSCRKFVFQFQYRKYNFECKTGFWFNPVLKHCSKDKAGVCSHEKASK
ncbi:uncharacterized protein LOC134832008 [Culicoides brevitarsis]|uniref:uncharacterized protein LOC134832008 n=1 Tax=Culicoides brevitarsis TaxID=469753 RepID=UPI00307B7EE4